MVWVITVSKSSTIVPYLVKPQYQIDNTVLSMKYQNRPALQHTCSLAVNFVIGSVTGYSDLTVS